MTHGATTRACNVKYANRWMTLVFFWSVPVYLLFSANTVTGKRIRSHPALAAWVGARKKSQRSIILNYKPDWND